MKKLKKLVLVLLVTAIGLSCKTVKPYEKMYINDPCMALQAFKLDYFEINFQTYREGASGANGGKVGGGCGCN